MHLKGFLKFSLPKCFFFSLFLACTDSYQSKYYVIISIVNIFFIKNKQATLVPFKSAWYSHRALKKTPTETVVLNMFVLFYVFAVSSFVSFLGLIVSPVASASYT